MMLSFFIMGQSDLKKCHLCGTALDNSEQKVREVDEEYYCILCIDEDGKPRNSNPVVSSILRFWRERKSDEKESIKHGS